MTWVLDLDGVIWLGDQAVPGAAEAVDRLRQGGERVLFATNNSWPVVGEQEAKLADMGIRADGDLVTSAMAAAELLEPQKRALVCGGPGITEALRRRGVEVVDAGDPEADGYVGELDAVVVGIHPDFDYRRLRVSAQAVRFGARLLATNEDATYPTAEGLLPGGGAIVAAIAYAAEVEPEVAGKPHRPMADLIHGLVGDHGVANGGPVVNGGVMVGDRPETDGAFAHTLGYRFGLVLTGVTGPDDLPVEPPPDLVAPNLSRLVDAWLSLPPESRS